MGPPPGIRLVPWAYDGEMYKRRNEVERLFRRSNGIRRIFSRVEKLAVIFRDYMICAIIFDALRQCQHALVIFECGGRSVHTYLGNSIVCSV